MILSIVVPCYNEEAVLTDTTGKLVAVLQDLRDAGAVSDRSYICYIDDGSSDQTWAMIERFSAQHACVCGIKLSRNRGHQNALLAGLLTVECDAVISLDADLQDDLGVVPDMVAAFRNGSDIVYGVRKRRETDSFFKRFTAQAYYRVLELFGVEIVYNHADYRLMSKRAVDALRQFGEVNLFLRGVVPQIGFQSTVVYYDRFERMAGESKYPLTKMLALAWQGITSFSAVPLRVITVLGVLVSMGSLGLTVWVVLVRLFSDVNVPGWASTLVPMLVLGGVQLLSIGVIGEYLAKIYEEIKSRPRYILEKEVGFGSSRGKPEA